MPARRITNLLLGVTALCLVRVHAQNLPSPEVAGADGSLARDLVRKLERSHYSKLKVDNEMSKRLFDKMFKSLDPDKKFFLKGDHDTFKRKWEYKLDDDIENRDLSFVYELKKVYAERVKARLGEVPAILKRPMDFSKDETYQSDGEKKDYVKTEDEVRERWFKLLKYQVLTRKITKDRENRTAEDKKSPEEILENIHQQMLKSYTRMERYALKTRAEKMVQIFMDTLCAVFDPHSTYFSPSELENFNIAMRLSFEGIGAALVSKDGYTKVVRIIPGGPAERQGILQPEDLILEVAQGDGERVNVVGMELDEVVQLIRGKAKTEVRLTVRPASAGDDSEGRVVAIIRDKVKLEESSAKSTILSFGEGSQQKRFGFIKLPSFYRDFRQRVANARSSSRDVSRLIDELTAQNVDGLIIDLRNNGGGSLPDAIEMAGLFIEKGPIVLVRQRNGAALAQRDPDPTVHYKGPLLLMVNHFSASASEIFAAAMQDYKRAIVVGNKKTHGKGTVQKIDYVDVGNGILASPKKGALKLTISKFYRISGHSTQLRGVEPDLLLPGLYDGIKLGEAAHDYALPWDQIEPADHGGFENAVLARDAVRQKSAERVAESAHFLNVRQQAEIISRNRNDTLVSLNEAEVLRKNQELRKLNLEARRAKRKWQLEQELISKELFDLWEQRDAKGVEVDPEQIESEEIRFRDQIRRLPQEEREAWERRSWRDSEVEEAMAILADAIGPPAE